MKKFESTYVKELEGIILGIKDRRLLHDFLIDLLSPAEFQAFSLRWQIIKMLHQGHSHRDISKKLKVSIATVTRGSREMINKKGGFAAL